MQILILLLETQDVFFRRKVLDRMTVSNNSRYGDNIAHIVSAGFFFGRPLRAILFMRSPGLRDRVEFFKHGDNIAHNEELRKKADQSHSQGKHRERRCVI